MVALFLIALGLGPLALRLFEDKLPEEALEYADQLRGAAKKMRQLMLEQARTRSSDPVPDSLDGLTVSVPDTGWDFPVARAFQAIEAAADWHEKVSRMICSIHAWY